MDHNESKARLLPHCPNSIEELLKWKQAYLIRLKDYLIDHKTIPPTNFRAEVSEPSKLLILKLARLAERNFSPYLDRPEYKDLIREIQTNYGKIQIGRDFILHLADLVRDERQNQIKFKKGRRSFPLTFKLELLSVVQHCRVNKVSFPARETLQIFNDLLIGDSSDIGRLYAELFNDKYAIWIGANRNQSKNKFELMKNLNELIKYSVLNQYISRDGGRIFEKRKNSVHKNLETFVKMNSEGFYEQLTNCCERRAVTGFGPSKDGCLHSIEKSVTSFCGQTCVFTNYFLKAVQSDKICLNE